MHHNFQKGLNQNQLKIIAAAAMFLDHVGAELLPQLLPLRILGRLAFPIFSYFIYEGCRYTRNKGRYLGQIFLLGLLCVFVYYIFTGDIYGNVLITFSGSICAIYSLQNLETKLKCYANKKGKFGLFTAFGMIIACFFCITMVCQIIYIDYGFWGVILPVFAEIGRIAGDCALVFKKTVWGKYKACERFKTHRYALIGFSLGLFILSASLGGYQYFSLLSILLLTLYNGSRGKLRMKYFFYWFYPLHLALIGFLGMLL